MFMNLWLEFIAAFSVSFARPPICYLCHLIQEPWRVQTRLLYVVPPGISAFFAVP